MPPGGRLMAEHLGEKFGSAEAFAERTALLQVRAAEAGADIRLGDQARVWNTFDAHRLLHWAAGPKQVALKLALFRTYFTERRDVGDHGLLAELAAEVGLDPAAARAMLDQGRLSDEVRREEMLWRQRGISGVPATIVDGRYLISGGQSAEAYEAALRQIAAAAETVSS
jgi:predicted DsbA family dithiol-disulfide isomerase